MKLRNVNRLVLGQIHFHSIRNMFELLFSLVSNNSDVLLISEEKIDNTFPVSNSVYMDTKYHSDLTVPGMDEVLCHMLRSQSTL